MKTDSAPQVVSAEKLDGGVVISFEDGRSAVYSAELLSEIFRQAREIPEEDEHEDESDVKRR